MAAVDTLYETRKTGRGNVGDSIPIRLIGGTVSIIIYGSATKPANISDMADISSDDSPFVLEDYYQFASLPRYIAFVGTVTDIETDNVRLIDLGAIS